jgi:hypothetical protein
MNEAAMKRTLKRHQEYRRKAGYIGSRLRDIAFGCAPGSLKDTLAQFADELDPPGVILASETA